jgi:cell division control protein 24
LQELLKVATPDKLYPHLRALEQGVEASKRIFTKINEVMDRGDRARARASLIRRVADWKGHQVENFGELLLHDTLAVTKSDIEREFYVCVFEKVVLCCKEAEPAPPPRAPRGGRPDIGARNTPLLLKGRIFVSNIAEAIQVRQQAGPTSASIRL